MFIRRCPKCNVLAGRWPGDPHMEGGARCAMDCPPWDNWPFNEEKPDGHQDQQAQPE
jgi:hypothetical protein